jgi:integrase
LTVCAEQNSVPPGYAPRRNFRADMGPTGGSFRGSDAAGVPEQNRYPKTHHSVRKAAITDGIWLELDQWRSSSRYKSYQSFVFPSERGTALSKDNVWRRNMQPALAKVGLGWANFQVMRRTHATLMRQMKADPKAVADQLGHSLDVSLNVYAQSPVSVRQPLVSELEKLIIK